MVESDDSLTCGQCRKSGNFTAPVSVILVFAPGLSKPYPLIPAEEYRVCGACNAIFTLVTRATEAHPTTQVHGGRLIEPRVGVESQLAARSNIVAMRAGLIGRRHAFGRAAAVEPAAIEVALAGVVR